MELDWREGEVFDSRGRDLICSTHGATYAADSGKCLGGPARHAAGAAAVEETGRQGVSSKESTMADNDGQWERGLIEKLATEALKEQRRARRWGIFWKLLTFAYITV
jgi:hypothetical protein